MLVWESQCFDLKEMAECQESCKLSKVLASFAGADKNTLCLFLLCSLTKDKYIYGQ